MTLQLKAHVVRTPSGRVLQGPFDLEVPRGGRLGITGPSGCGKSTLLRQIIDQLTTKSSDSSLSNVSIEYVPQSDFLFPWYSARQNYAAWRQMPPEERHLALARRLGIGSIIDHRYGQLSGGERQRVSLWILLCGSADVALIDEPFTALDINSKMICMEAAAEWISAGSRSLIVISHDVDVLTYLADRIFVFGESHIIPTRELRIQHDPPTSRSEYIERVRVGTYSEILAALTAARGP